MTENPERLWVTCASDGVAIETRGYDNKRDADAYRDGLHSHRNAHAFTPVAEYIRADIAAAEKADAVDRAVGVACCRPTHLGGEIGQTDRCGECFVCLREEASAAVALRQEKAALVSERDALVARVEKLRSELQNIFDESDSSEHSIVRVESMAVLADQALTEDDALSGKGVG